MTVALNFAHSSSVSGPRPEIARPKNICTMVKGCSPGTGHAARGFSKVLHPAKKQHVNAIMKRMSERDSCLGNARRTFGESRHDLFGKGLKRGDRAGRIDQQNVLD